MEIYLDSASSAPPLPAAVAAAAEAAAAFGDPLRPHGSGRRARDLLELARQEIAEALAAQPDELVFTSGGTESAALALGGVARAAGAPGDRVLVSAVEHPCVLGSAEVLVARGFEVVRIPVDEFGRMDADAFLAEVRKPGTLLASVQHSNHEVGTLQPLAEAVRLAHEAGVWIHTDACQSVGRLPMDVQALDVDLLTLSGHKFGGPAGIGALYTRRGVPLAGHPAGDDRERHRRAGMENVAGAAGMAAALLASLEELSDQAAAQWALTNHLRSGIADIPGAVVHGHPTQRAPHLVCFSVPHLDPEVLLMALDDRGFQVGGGAIASGLPHVSSPVLEAMGVTGMPSFRIGVSRLTTQEHVEQLLAALVGLVAELSRMEEASADTLERMGQAPPEPPAD